MRDGNDLAALCRYLAERCFQLARQAKSDPDIAAALISLARELEERAAQG